jgi:hypothetical protein
VRLDVEPLKLLDQIVFVDAQWTVAQFLDHLVAHLFPDLARDAISLVRADSLALLADSAALLDASIPAASANVRFLLKRLQPVASAAAAPAAPGLYSQLPPIQVGKPIYDIIPSLNDAIDRPAAAAAAAAAADATLRRRPDLPAKTGVEFTAPAAAAVVRAAAANRSASGDIDNSNTIDNGADDPAKVRIVSGAFFEDLLSDLNAIEFEEAAAKRESGQFGVAAGFDALLNDAELCGDIQIDTQTIQSKKLNTLFDLIDEEDQAAAGTT